MKYITLLFVLVASLNAGPTLMVSPDEGKIKLRVKDLPAGKAVVILTSTNLTDWTLAQDEYIEPCIYMVPDEQPVEESVYWCILTNKNKSFFRVVVLNYK